ncbi:MAG: NAD(P)-binding domain-containing protein [Gammaproteobacteria bacterium]
MTLAGATDVVVIGAGHAGLAMSRYLSAAAIDHVVLERGEIANSWRRERWDSLRLLTPNWQSRLPGHAYSGPDPDGFMTMSEVIGFVDGYAKVINAPVRTFTAVVSVSPVDGGYQVLTDRRVWRARAVVLASGASGVPNISPLSSALPASIRSLTPREYRSPNQLDDRTVLVVGASASGVQLADEIQRSGRRVMLAVGEHIRMPRLYRGRDIQWWLDAAGVLDERYDAVDDIVRARRVPSPQLIGTPDRSTLDLDTLTERGVEIVGRLAGIVDGKAQFSGSLRNHCAMADLKLGRLLERIDDWVERSGGGGEVPAAERFTPTHAPEAPRLLVDLAANRIGTVLWATGFRPDYRWLRVPAFDRKGHLRHDGGIVDAPGLYALGLNFMRRRKSSFIHGAEDDVRELGAHLVAYLRQTPFGDSPPSTTNTSACGTAHRRVDSTGLKSNFH